MTLAASGAYSALTVVNQGDLVVGSSLGFPDSAVFNVAGGTLDVSALSGGLNLGPGQTLSGLGSVKGAVNLAAGGALSPGSPSTIGTLTVGSIVVNPGSVLNWKISSPSNLDGLSVTGSNGLSIVGGGINLYAGTTGSPFTGSGSYVLGSYSGLLQGSPANLSVLNPYAADIYLFNASGGSLTVQVLQNVPTWTGASGIDNHWLTPGNWTVPVLGTGGETIAFAGSGTTSVNDFASAQFANLVFTASAGSFNLGGSGITLSNTLAYIANFSSNPQTIVMPVMLAGPLAVTPAPGG